MWILFYPFIGAWDLLQHGLLYCTVYIDDDMFSTNGKSKSFFMLNIEVSLFLTYFTLMRGMTDKFKD